MSYAHFIIYLEKQNVTTDLVAVYFAARNKEVMIGGLLDSVTFSNWEKHFY